MSTPRTAAPRPGLPQRTVAAAETQRTGERERTAVEHGTVDPGEKGFLERQREQRPWLDHVVRAGGRYTAQKGDYFAAGITYYTVLALVPIIMIAFAALGFVLAGNHDPRPRQGAPLPYGPPLRLSFGLVLRRGK